MLLAATLRYLPAQVLAPLAQLVSMVAWTHWLTPLELGVFTLVVTTQELAYLASLSWFSVHALRHLPGQEHDAATRRRYLETENAVVLAACALSAVAALLLARSLPDSGDAWRLGAASALFFVARAANAHYAERARAQSGYVAYTLLQSVGPLAGLVFGVAALQWLQASATVLCLCYAAAHALGVVLAWPALGMHWRLARPDAALLRGAMRFGGPMLALAALGWVAENHLRYLVQWHSGTAAIGLMAVGWGLGRRCASVASMLVTTAGFPIAARLLNEGRRDEAITQLGLNASLLLAVTLPVCAGLALIGPALVELTVAPEYREVTAQLLGLSVMSGAMRCLHVHVTDQWLVLEKRFGLAAWVDAIEIAGCASLSLAGLAWFGLPGAVAGQLAGSALALAASLYWAAFRFDFRWPLVDTGKLTLATAAMSAMLAGFGGRAGVAGIAIDIALGGAVLALSLALLYRDTLGRRTATWRLQRRAAQP